MITRLLESWDSSRLALADIHVNFHGVTDGPIDWWTNELSYRDSIMHLVSLLKLLWHLYAQKYWFPLFFCKSVTNRRTDRRTDTRSYRDARTHLKTGTGTGQWALPKTSGWILFLARQKVCWSQLSFYVWKVKTKTRRQKLFHLQLSSPFFQVPNWWWWWVIFHNCKIFICYVRSIITSEKIEIESPGCSGFQASKP